MIQALNKAVAPIWIPKPTGVDLTPSGNDAGSGVKSQNVKGKQIVSQEM